ncbi:hypothetical protein BC940DRAFT_300490 [Gongronella butleri]|nr:hypothetical protein BC940DRAFT_300490 [Gongronella butleri]
MSSPNVEHELIPPLQMTEYMLGGAVLGISFPLILTSSYYFVVDKSNRLIRALKFIMASCFFIKTALLTSFDTYNVPCEQYGRTVSLLYHIAMVCGNMVLLERLAAIVRPNLKKYARAFEFFILALRFAVGIWDTLSVYSGEQAGGYCLYIDKALVGSVYTTIDTFVDLYVTVCICVILVRHMKRLNIDGMATRTNIRTYFAVTFVNSFRTAILTVVNLLAAIAMGSRDQFVPLVHVLWPLTNYIFILLVGYDADLTKAVRELPGKTKAGLRQQRENSSTPHHTPTPTNA